MEHRPAQSAGPREHQAARSGGPPAGKGRPQPVENRTMAIGMPDGYSDRPPRRMWPLVIAIMAAGAAAGVIAFFIARPDRPERQAQPAPRRGGPTVASGSGAGADAGPRRARIRLTTRPSGAEVFDAAGKLIGTTPTDLSLAVDGREVVLRFHHVDAADSEKRFTPTGDTAFDIELPPPASAAGAEPDQPDEGEADAGAEAEKDSPPEARKAPRRPEKRRPRRRKKPTTDLLRPEL